MGPSLRYHLYAESFDPREHARLRETFERALEREPRAAEGWACLALLYEHEHSFGFNPLPDSTSRERRAAERANELDPNSQQAWIALASVFALGVFHFYGPQRGLEFTTGYLIETAPPRATNTLLRLTSLLRSVLRSEGEFTSLGREVELVEHYLEIERERFEERLRVAIDVPPALRALPVPCLLVQPLVENAVKHGIAPAILGGEVRVEARLDASTGTQVLVLVVANTGAPMAATLDARSSGGVGLTNVERRLAGHYGAHASLALSSAQGVTTAEVRLPAGQAAAREPGARRAVG